MFVIEHVFFVIEVIKAFYAETSNTCFLNNTPHLVSKVTFPSGNFPALTKTFWKGWMEIYTDELKKRIKAEPNFSECFE